MIDTVVSNIVKEPEKYETYALWSYFLVLLSTIFSVIFTLFVLVVMTCKYM